MNIDFLNEIKKKEHVKKAYDIANLANGIVKWFDCHTFDDPNTEIKLEKAFAYLKKIESLLSCEGTWYLRNFYRACRTYNDSPSLDTEIYEYATYIYEDLKKYDLALTYCSKVCDDYDNYRIDEFSKRLVQIRKEKDKAVAEAKAEAKAEAEKNARAATPVREAFSFIFGILAIVFYVATVVFSIYIFNDGSHINIVSKVFLGIIAAMIFSASMSVGDDDNVYRPVLLAPVGYALFSLIYYIFGGGYKIHKLLILYVIKHFFICIGIIIAAFVIGTIIDSLINSKADEKEKEEKLKRLNK